MKTSQMLLAALAPWLLSAVEVDGVAARVGSATVLKSDVYREMARAGADPSRYVEFRNQLIDRELILKAAQESKLVLQDWVVEERIQEIINRAFGGDRNRLMATLSRDKISYPEWHQRMRDDMIVGAMRYQFVDKGVTQCSPAEMRAEWQAHPERYRLDHKVTVSVILLSPADAAKREAVNAALKESAFGEVAKRFSADAHAADGGQWKDVVPEECFRAEIAAEIAKMPVDTISAWIDLDGWSFLLRKDAEDAGRQLEFADAYELIQNTLREERARRTYLAWLERLRSQTYIKTY